MNRWFLFLLSATVPLAAQVKFIQSDGQIAVEIDGKPFTTLYVSGPGVLKPYLHPLRSASGKIVTRQYPMEQTEGERHDHPHHRGLWFAHGDVNGVDFWTNEPGQRGAKKGRIVSANVVSLTSGAKSGSIKAVFDWQGPEGVSLVTETRTTTFYADPKLRTIDCDIDLTPAAGEVKFGDTKEGAFAIRLAPWLEEDAKDAPAPPKRTGQMVNAAGARGEEAVWGKRSNWADYSGEAGGEKLGVAILDHPANPGHPVRWHARGYGLFAANPFGLREFERDNTKTGGLTLAPGHSLRFRYRVIIHPGDAASADIAALWKQYAQTQ